MTFFISSRALLRSLTLGSLAFAALLTATAAYAQSQPSAPNNIDQNKTIVEIVPIAPAAEPDKAAAKPAEATKVKPKPVEGKSAETTPPSEAKSPNETKSSEAKPAEAKRETKSETKHDARRAEIEHAENKHAEGKSTEGKPADNKPASAAKTGNSANNANNASAKDEQDDGKTVITFAEISKQARALAAQSYKQPASNLPAELQDLKYAGYQNVQLRDDRTYWRDDGTAFRLSFYHQGMHFNTPVMIDEVDEHGIAHPIKFNPDDFNYGDLKVDPNLLKNLGFAGFKVLYPVNTVTKPNDELASFLGASYFRVIGRGQTYGLSARGLAIDTALPSGEEFPAFRKYWIVKPAKGAHEITLYALLDSPRATGAYRFTIRPNIDTVIDVKARIYLRAKVGRLGIAPLTSMFLYGANQPSPTPNYRPEMHDSEGLAMHTGNDEWLWRPLNNPKRLAVSAFNMQDPRGFGLLQRTRGFHRYEDLDDHYEKRPSLWIEPVGEWGKGSVQLVEIPTPDETNDNIVAFWVPEKQPENNTTPLDLEYRMTWTLDEPRTHATPLAWVMQTRRSRDEVKGPDLIRHGDGSTAFIIDFVGPSLKDLPDDMVVSANVWADANGQIVENTVRPNPVTGGRRLMLRVNVKDPAKPVEMRATLGNGQIPLSETWTYQLPGNDEAK